MSKLVEKLEELSKEFSSSDNEILKLAEEECDHADLLQVAQCLISVAQQINSISCTIRNKKEASISLENLNEIAILAESFDKSGDEFLQKQASVLDQLLINFNQINRKKFAQEQVEKIRERLREKTIEDKYHTASKEHNKDNKSKDALKAIDDTMKDRSYRPLEAPLKTRHCLEHSGIMLLRVGEDTYQCPLDKKTYDYRSGFTLMDGTKVPGGSVSEQTRSLGDRIIEKPYFSTRESKTKGF